MCYAPVLWLLSCFLFTLASYFFSPEMILQCVFLSLKHSGLLTYTRRPPVCLVWLALELSSHLLMRADGPVVRHFISCFLIQEVPLALKKNAVIIRGEYGWRTQMVLCCRFVEYADGYV